MSVSHSPTIALSFAGINLVGQLLFARLRWYALCTGRLLMRHWQWFVLALALLPAGLSLSQVVAVIGYPFATMLDSDQSFLERVGCQSLLFVLVVLWVNPQRQQILGTEFDAYLQSLPIGCFARIVTDVGMLAASLSLVLVPLFAIMFNAADPDLIPSHRRVMPLLVYVGAFLLAGYSAVHLRWRLLAMVFVSSVILATGPLMSVRMAEGGVLLLAAGLIATGFYLACSSTRRSKNLFQQRTALHSITRLQPNTGIFLVIPWRVLAAHRSVVVLRLGLVGMLTALAVFLQGRFGYDTRALGVSIATLAVIALLLSGLYRHMRRAHHGSRVWSAALPIRHRYLMYSDVLCLCVLAIPFTSITALSLVVNGVSSGPAVVLLVFAQLLLLALLCTVSELAGRQGVLVGALLAVVWILALGLTL